MDPYLALKREYLEGAVAKLPEMAAWLQSGRLDALQSAAHKLAGSGGFYGFDAISEAGRRLEEELRAGADDLGEAFRLLSEAIHAAIAHVDARRSEQGGLPPA